MHHPSRAFGMAQGYIRVQIDFAHLRAQLTGLHVLTGISEMNIGTALISHPESGMRRPGRGLKSHPLRNLRNLRTFALARAVH